MGNSTFGSKSSSGGAIYNYNDSTFILNGNGAVTFSENTAFSGGAIYNSGTFTLSGNGDVLFEKNAEIVNGTYRLRSIYSIGTLNLSASGGKSIMFNDSVYASGTVNLNQDGTGNIIFTGATTEADLREVKGGVDGTAEEILNSRTSELATNAKLYGGRLIVEEGAILKGQGITVTEGANAVIRLNNGEIDESRYEIAISSGSGLEFEGENTLTASAIRMEDGATLSFVLGGSTEPLVNLNATLLTRNLSITLSGNTEGTHQLISLYDASQYDLSLWTEDNITFNGASFSDFSWNAGVLTYSHVTPPDIDLDADMTLENGSAEADKLQSGGDVTINGNGHTLSVKNAVQLVQMALKDGTVKLESENNNVVSVSLTEGGELVLTAGAGLTTGDIISMVASGKGELVISGDITLDDKGMKGKDGNLATVSHADMKVLGDASISNVRVEDSTIDLLEGSTVNFTNVVLAATARITDDPATANLNDVYAELVLGVNAEQTGCGELSCGSVLTQTGNTGEALTLADDASVLLLEATTFDSVLLTGTTLTLDLSGLSDEAYNGAAFIGISFTSGKAYATFDNTLEVLFTMDGITYTPGYTLGGDATTVYFRGGNAPVVPEPATATLSLLALATLAARRRRLLPKVY